MKKWLALAGVIALCAAPTGRAAVDLGTPAPAGVVVCTSAPACDAGAMVLARGGNAVDAAVATAFALAVTHPSAGNIGGGGFMIVRPAGRAPTSFDFREKAPLASTPKMYLKEDGSIDRPLTAAGYLAPGVPGTVRGLEAAHKKFGKLPWKDVVMPAVELAEQGFVLSPALARSLNTEMKRMAAFPASVAAYGKPGGGEWTAGDRMILTDLGRTLRAIATDGPGVFYKGWIADRIAEDMKANGGLITREDLAAYQARERRPVLGTYRGFDIVSMPPPSSGGVALIEMLNILEPLNLKLTKGLLTVPALHAQAEAMRRAYLDRARFLGDPDFGEIPVARLTSKSHAKQAASSIDMLHASSSAALGKDLLGATPAPEPDETTHFSVLDRAGMAVATTYTLEGGFGSHVVVKGAGFLLNNEMGDFNRQPGHDHRDRRYRDAGEPHRPGKADAQLDDADDRHEERQAGARHRLPGRPHDHQYRVDRGARSHRVRPQRPRSGRSAAHPPSVDAGPDFVRGRPAEAAGHLGFEGAWARAHHHAASGRRAHGLGLRRRDRLRRARHAIARRQGVRPHPFDSASGRAIG